MSYSRSIFTLVAVAALSGVVFATACSDDPSTSDGNVDAGTADVLDTGLPNELELELPHAGSRLTPRFVTTADGLKAYVGLYDQKLGARCTVTDIYDDSLRCAPTADRSFATVFYADAACTRPIIDLVTQGPVECAAPAFVDIELTPAATCKPARKALYRIAAPKVDLPAVYAKTGPNGACEAGTSVGSYTELALVPPSDLVRLTEGIEPRTGQIGVPVLAGDDGARLPTTLLADRARGNATCRASLANDGKSRCVPASGPTAHGYLDPACSKMGIASATCPKENDPNAKYVTRDVAQNCSATSIVSELGPKHPSRDEYFGTETDCNGPSTQTSDVYTLGPEVSPALFPLLERVDVGGTRVGMSGFIVGGKRIFTDTSTFKDKKDDRDCTFALAADGKLRCLPTSIDVLYLDPGCKTAVGAQLKTGCAAPKTAQALSLECPLVAKVFTVAEKLNEKRAYQRTVTECLPTTDAIALYALGAEIPPESFVEGAFAPK